MHIPISARPKVERLFAVYLPGEDSRKSVQRFVGSDYAAELVQDGFADWLNARGKSLRLKKRIADIRGLSAHISGSGIHRLCTMRGEYKQSVLDAWRPA